jgi:hypothetical protein
MRRSWFTALAIPALCLAPQGARAQEQAGEGRSVALPVFLDCNAPDCDFDHFRRQIPWVNWVRNREDADVHLLVTAQNTGGGGWRYTLDYITRNAGSGPSKTLIFTSDPDDTDPEVRDGLTRTMALGLVQFAETTPIGPRLEVVYHEAEVPVVAAQASDPWNLWVFQIGLDGSLEGEARQQNYGLEASIDADRVAEGFKININGDAEYDYEEFELDDGELVQSSSEDYSASVLAAWSVTGRWSAGLIAEGGRSTYRNWDLALSAGPAVEFNLFPYAESTRRSLTFAYALELTSFNYDTITVEGKLEEVLPRHRFRVSTAIQQPWGEIHGSVEATQYLNNLATHRIETFLSLEYRLFRGLSLDVFGEFARIKDQFALPAGDVPPEEVLLRRRERETDYQFDIGIGLSYRFGSKFANIVNPRFD